MSGEQVERMADALIRADGRAASTARAGKERRTEPTATATTDVPGVEAPMPLVVPPFIDDVPVDVAPPKPGVATPPTDEVIPPTVPYTPIQEAPPPPPSKVGEAAETAGYRVGHMQTSETSPPWWAPPPKQSDDGPIDDGRDQDYDQGDYEDGGTDPGREDGPSAPIYSPIDKARSAAEVDDGRETGRARRVYDEPLPDEASRVHDADDDAFDEDHGIFEPIFRIARQRLWLFLAATGILALIVIVMLSKALDPGPGASPAPTTPVSVTSKPGDTTGPGTTSGPGGTTTPTAPTAGCALGEGLDELFGAGTGNPACDDAQAFNVGLRYEYDGSPATIKPQYGDIKAAGLASITLTSDTAARIAAACTSDPSFHCNNRIPPGGTYTVWMIEFAEGIGIAPNASWEAGIGMFDTSPLTGSTAKAWNAQPADPFNGNNGIATVRFGSGSIKGGVFGPFYLFYDGASSGSFFMDQPVDVFAWTSGDTMIGFIPDSIWKGVRTVRFFSYYGIDNNGGGAVDMAPAPADPRLTPPATLRDLGSH
jgi:hypothetical protein